MKGHPKPKTKPDTTMTKEELAAEVERLKAENAKLAAKKAASVKLKVSEKGAVSIYGLGRFPVTLYREQMETLLGKADEIRQFIADNAARLKLKEA